MLEKTSPHEKAKEQLKNLAKLIQENPSLIVQISTHTDSRGSKEYNARLICFHYRRNGRRIEKIKLKNTPKKRDNQLLIVPFL